MNDHNINNAEQTNVSGVTRELLEEHGGEME